MVYQHGPPRNQLPKHKQTTTLRWIFQQMNHYQKPCPKSMVPWYFLALFQTEFNLTFDTPAHLFLWKEVACKCPPKLSGLFCFILNAMSTKTVWLLAVRELFCKRLCLSAGAAHITTTAHLSESVSGRPPSPAHQTLPTCAIEGGAACQSHHTSLFIHALRF